MPIELLSEIEHLWMKFLVHGYAGVGKTTLLASAMDVPEMHPILFIDCDRGTLSIRDRGDILIWRINAYPEMNDVVNGPILQFEEYKDEHPDEPLPDTPFRTVILDGFAALYRIHMEYEMDGLIARHPSRDPLVPDKREYGRVRTRTLKLLRVLRDAPMHVLIACASHYNIEEDEGIHIHVPHLAGKLSTEVQDYVNILGYLAIQQGKEGTRVRKLIVQPSRKIHAKDRAALGVTALTNPTMVDIFKRCTHLRKE